MQDDQLQQWVERVSLQAFGKPFRHRATFNPRLRTSGGRYFMKSHNIEINPHQLAEHGETETEKIIKHELCHYHLNLERRGYRHQDADFKALLARVGGTRFCQALKGPEGQRRMLPYRYQLTCRSCGQSYMRKRKVDPRKYVCGRCNGRLVLLALGQSQ